jgi:DnaJ domain
MACVCKSCVDHAHTLGAAQALTSKTAIHKAYRAAAKRWHPDRFPNDERKRHEAEDRFKRIHAAYEALCEHLETPVRTTQEAESDAEFVTPIQSFFMPTIFFGDAPGCYAAPDFPPAVQACIAAARPDASEKPVGFINLIPEKTRISEFILLTNHRMYIRDANEILSTVWYNDLDEIRLIDNHAGKQPSAWQRIAESVAGKGPRYTLEIGRYNGKHFYTLDERPSDRVKKVVYNFLRQMKSKTQP